MPRQILQISNDSLYPNIKSHLTSDLTFKFEPKMYYIFKESIIYHYYTNLSIIS